MNQLPLNSKSVYAGLGFCLGTSCYMGYEGFLLMLTGDDLRTHITAALTAFTGSFGCTAVLWYTLQRAVVPLDPMYRNKVLPWMVAGTVTVAFMVGATPTFVRLGHDTAYRLELRQNISANEQALDLSYSNAQKILIFKNIIESKSSELSNLAIAETEGLVSGMKGRGETYRRLKQAVSALNAVIIMLDEQEADIERIVRKASRHLQEMRDAVPNDLDIPPLDRLPEYLISQRSFSIAHKQLIENDVRLQVQVALEGLDQSIVTTSAEQQSRNLQAIDRKLSSIAQSLITALNNQDLTAALLPEWQLGSPVWTCFKHLAHLWQALGVALAIEYVPLFWLLASFAQHRQDQSENTDRTAYTIEQLTTLAGALNAVNDVRRDAISLNNKIERNQK